MTIDQGGRNLPANIMDDEDFLEGLDDIKPEDMGAPPRMTIEHHEAVFKVSSTGEEFSSANFIILGLVRQRTMWHPEIPDGESPPPMCKSPDFEHGFPEMSEDVKADFRFPWGASSFDLTDLTDHGEGIKQSLNCADCRFKDWGSDPTSDRPWCSEEFTLPLLYQSEDGEWAPALLTLKRSALKPIKTYMASFKSSRTPMFAVVTRAGLTQNKRGNVRYCVPSFSKGEQTDQEMWQEYLDSFKGVRDYLKSFPAVRTEESESESGGLAGADEDDSPWGGSEPPKKSAPKKAPPAAPKTRPAQKAKPEPEPEEVTAEVVPDDDDDEPPF